MWLSVVCTIIYNNIMCHHSCGQNLLWTHHSAAPSVSPQHFENHDDTC